MILILRRQKQNKLVSSHQKIKKMVKKKREIFTPFLLSSFLLSNTF